MKGSIPLAGWVALLAGVLGILHVLGRGALATPPFTRPDALAGWLEQRSAAEVAFGVLRLAVMGLSGYLLVSTLAGLLARTAGLTRCCAALDVVSPALVRRLLQGAAGVTVVATVAVPQATAWAAPGAEPATASRVPVMHRLPSNAPGTREPGAPAGATPAPSSSTTSAATTSPPPTSMPPTSMPVQLAPPTTTLLPTAPPASTTASATPRTNTLAPAETPAPSASGPAPAQPAQPSTWVVRPGDNLWSIAESTLVRAWGRTPSDSEVDGYWTALVVANRSQLANRDDPDLIFPGQVFQLPPTPG